MQEKILESTRWVVERSKWVRINDDSIPLAILRYGRSFSPVLQEELGCIGEGDKGVEWLFVVEILNHCFWCNPGEQRWEIEYKGKWLSGYWALTGSLKKAFKQGIPLHKADFLASMDLETLSEIFGGKGQIPLIRERCHNLREAGRILLDKWQGSILNLLEEASNSALKLVRLLVENFSSFKDEAVYENRRVYFYKRAQIFPADLYECFKGKSWGMWKDLDKLTVFADYKLPQVLRQLGILVYHPKLASQVDNYKLLPMGSPEEIEIRANTIHASERIKKNQEKSAGIYHLSFHIDKWLWYLGQDDSFRKHPHHRTRTIYY